MTQNSIRRLMMLPLFAALLLLSYRSLALDRLEGRILDDKTGESGRSHAVAFRWRRKAARNRGQTFPRASTWANADATWMGHSC